MCGGSDEGHVRHADENPETLSRRSPSLFFFKQKTAYEMRISNWSSDVCSFDLAYLAAPERRPEEWGGELPAGQQDRARQVGDFISGMTDRYALARYRELTGKPSPLPDGF